MSKTSSSLAMPRRAVDAIEVHQGRALRVSRWSGSSPFWSRCVHAATAGRYDAQRNELYFLVCGWHPDFGYVDQPPLVPLIAAATQIFGVNIWMLRLPATIVAVGLVLLCAAFARLLGGGSRAAALAAIAAGIAPALPGSPRI